MSTARKKYEEMRSKALLLEEMLAQEKGKKVEKETELSSMQRLYILNICENLDSCVILHIHYTYELCLNYILLLLYFHLNLFSGI